MQWSESKSPRRSDRNGCDLRRRMDAITCMSGRMSGTVDVDKRVTLDGGGADIN